MVKKRPSEEFRAGFVALIGRPNVGKSTLLNRILGEKIAIATPRPQTTRNRIVGVRNLPGAQLVLVDTPGLHRPSGRGRTKLNSYMVGEALQALGDVDSICAIVEAPTAKEAEGYKVDVGTKYVIDEIKAVDKPAILVINKVDLLRNKSLLLPVLEKLQAAHAWRAIIPISAKDGDNVERLEVELTKMLPVAEEAIFPEEMLTDRAERWIGAEFIREQVFLLTRQEVPYSCAVSIDTWEERGKDVMVEATIHVDKEAHKRMIVGEGGRMVREIGSRARHEISQLLAIPVHLKLFVRVDEGWTESARTLRELGYGEE